MSYTHWQIWLFKIHNVFVHLVSKKKRKLKSIIAKLFWQKNYPGLNISIFLPETSSDIYWVVYPMCF